MNCWVEVVVGEEVLATTKSKDTKETPPTWFKEILTFNVAESIQSCTITVYDDNDVVGSFDMEMKELFSTNKEQSYNEEFEFKE